MIKSHRFPSGFENEDNGGQSMEKHAALIGYLQEELGNYTIPDWMGSNVTPNDIWNLASETGETGEKRLLITYANAPSADFNTLLWPEVIHAWGNSKNPTHLKNYLTGRSCRLKKVCRTVVGHRFGHVL